MSGLSEAKGSATRRDLPAPPRFPLLTHRMFHPEVEAKYPMFNAQVQRRAHQTSPHQAQDLSRLQLVTQGGADDTSCIVADALR